MSQSLFSLEVVINYVKIQHEKVSCLFPCVAFRLLDYPTIAIHFLDDVDARRLKENLQIDQNCQPDLKITHFRDLIDKHGRYIFARGKSCLFRSELAVLRGHLRNAPLYVMLLDTYEEPYKLLGTSAVPLTNVIEEMCTELNETSLDMPCTKVTHGVFDIKNLMGDEIGHISFACRLSSFGSTLLPHIGVTNEAIERQNQLQRINKNQTSSAIQNVVTTTHVQTSKKEITNSLVQTVPIDYKTAQIQISNTEFSPDKIDTATQMEKRIQFDNFVETKPKGKKTVEDEFVFNHYCPPPLHYNAEQQIQKTVTKITTTTTECKRNVATAITQNIKVIKESKEVISEYEKQRIDYLNEAISNQEFLPELDYQETKQEVYEEENDEGYISSQQRVEMKKPQPQVNNKNFNLNEFPVLKCLIDEISKLQNLTTAPSEEIIPTRPKSGVRIAQLNDRPIKSAVVKPKKDQNLVGILKDRNNKKPVAKHPKMNKEEIAKSVDRLSTPRSVTKTKQQKPKLTYGTTNTHRMRVLASRPDKIKQIDEEHSLLIQKLQENLDEITESSQNITPRPSFNKKPTINEDRFDSNSAVNHMSISNSTYNSKSPLNLSLLNKVEMESTNDYALSRNLLNNINNLHERNSLQQSSNAQSSSIGANQKFVQFGNTYVFNNQSDESARTPTTSATASSTTTTTNSIGNKIAKSAKTNIFLPNKKTVQNKSPRSQTSSYSSSKQTSDDFEEEEDEDDLSIKLTSQLNLNKDEIDQLYGSNSRYSSNDFCTDTNKSKEIIEEEENIFSRDSRTSTSY